MRKLGPILLLVVLLAMALTASATPIRPDIRKLVAEPSQESIQFAPARAGWNGSESATNNTEFTTPGVERLTPAAVARDVRASLVALAIPDWRVLLGILALIILLRTTRRKATVKPIAAPNPIVQEEGLRPAA